MIQTPELLITWVEDQFMREVLGQKSWWLTDESRLADYAPWNDIEAAVGHVESGRFHFRVLEQSGVGQREAYPVSYRADTITTALRFFGVNIAPVFDLSLRDVIQFIDDRLKPEMRHHHYQRFREAQ